MILRYTLPLPPSVNDSLKAVTMGRVVRMVPTRAMKLWKVMAQTILKSKYRPTPMEGPVQVECEFFLPSLASDCSNRVKASEDILKGWAYFDDKQVAEGRQVKRIAESKEQERVLVTVTPATHPSHADVAARLALSRKRAGR